jgi:hypothetical protein
MSDTPEKESSGAWAHLISEIVAFIPKDLRELIGFMAGIYLFVSLPLLIFGGVRLVQKNIDKPDEQSAQCWQLQKIEERLFKLNTCTGETIEVPQIKSNSAPITIPTK